MKILDKIKEVSSITGLEKKEMYSLMSRHYDNVNENKFETDLAAKDGVMLLTNESDKLCGFSTFKLIETEYQNQNYHMLFSGDTIVDQQCWGQLALFRSFAKLMNYFLSLGEGPIYWFLITKGIRTYLMLPLYFKEYYPNHNIKTPPFYKSLIDHFGKLIFNEFYISKNGIIRIFPPADRLKNEFAKIPETKVDNPHVQYFLKKNPDYILGDELACLTEINWNNFTRATMKFMKNL